MNVWFGCSYLFLVVVLVDSLCLLFVICCFGVLCYFNLTIVGLGLDAFDFNLGRGCLSCLGFCRLFVFVWLFVWFSLDLPVVLILAVLLVCCFDGVVLICYFVL